ncbi:hypothetical protein BKP37_12485 [Anaerobacillus alkalilacustris]|uniref:Uncharacterized protein n=1 Tax=Anaerobacillus alkalilacustris TaxID=393763 RepID=A0A1S2LM72_9BACI|nr:aromatic acid exporter family protein [Anaerobacillus alkalilacustris]OIJ13310.1 hypothetical protein BKP37_12485 [Anaerobacillus alkalilacustris]
MKAFKLVGRRVLKTGIAVFITATICIKLDLPVIFAVITAIVTIEPTAVDSLKKGLVRLPAAAIGASFALLFNLLLGNSAITFALVTMFTIIICHHMKLDTGTLVATLTAVAMIPGTNDSFIYDFIVRISGTSLGIIISTLVNFALLPPKFGPLLVHKVDRLYRDVGFHLEDVISANLFQNKTYNETQFRSLNQDFEKAIKLSQHQMAEWCYRRKNEYEERSFSFLLKKLTFLQKLISHIGNINYIQLKSNELTKKEAEIIMTITKKVKVICSNTLHESEKDHEFPKDYFYALFKKEIQERKHYGQKGALFYELLSVMDCITVLQSETKKEHLFSTENKEYPTYIFPKKVQYD